MKIARTLVGLVLFSSFASAGEPIPFTDLTIADPATRARAFADRMGEDVRNARVVGIGESGHGVAEFHNERGFMAKALIENFGFRQVHIEQSVVAMRPLRDAVAACAAGPVDRARLFSVAKTALEPMIYGQREFYAFVEWMCDWNALHPADPVSLHGIDLWDAAWALRDAVGASLAKFALGAAADDAFAAAKANCFFWTVNSSDEAVKSDEYKRYLARFRLDPDRAALCFGALKNLSFLAGAKKDELVAKHGAAAYRDFEAALDSAIVRDQVRDNQYADLFKAMSQRDALQSRQTLRLLGDQKAVLLAHNVHIGKAMSRMRSDVVSPSDEYPGGAFVSSGEILKGTLGPGYAAIGVGGLDLSSIRDGHYPIPTSPLSLDFALSGACGATCIADVRDLRGEWWMHNETSPRGMWGVPSEQFDYYFFIRKSAAGTPLENAPAVP